MRLEHITGERIDFPEFLHLMDMNGLLARDQEQDVVYFKITEPLVFSGLSDYLETVFKDPEKRYLEIGHEGRFERLNQSDFTPRNLRRLKDIFGDWTSTFRGGGPRQDDLRHYLMRFKSLRPGVLSYFIEANQDAAHRIRGLAGEPNLDLYVGILSEEAQSLA